jgi:hypothetical protein
MVAGHGFAFGLLATSNFSRGLYVSDAYSTSTKSFTELADIRWFRIAATGSSGTLEVPSQVTSQALFASASGFRAARVRFMEWRSPSIERRSSRRPLRVILDALHAPSRGSVWVRRQGGCSPSPRVPRRVPGDIVNPEAETRHHPGVELEGVRFTFSALALWAISSAAACGMMPRSAWAKARAAPKSNHLWNPVLVVEDRAERPHAPQVLEQDGIEDIGGHAGHFTSLEKSVLCPIMASQPATGTIGSGLL